MGGGARVSGRSAEVAEAQSSAGVAVPDGRERGCLHGVLGCGGRWVSLGFEGDNYWPPTPSSKFRSV